VNQGKRLNGCAWHAKSYRTPNRCRHSNTATLDDQPIELVLAGQDSLQAIDKIAAVSTANASTSDIDHLPFLGTN